MTHICGMRDFGSSCPDLESWACQGCTHFLLKQLWFPWISALEVGRIPGPVFSSLWSWCELAQNCSGAGQVRGRRAQALLPTAGRGGFAKLCWSSIPSVLREGSCLFTPHEPMPDRHRWSKLRVPVVPWHAIRWTPPPKKAFFIWIEPPFSPSQKGKFLCLEGQECE